MDELRREAPVWQEGSFYKPFGGDLNDPFQSKMTAVEGRHDRSLKREIFFKGRKQKQTN